MTPRLAIQEGLVPGGTLAEKMARALEAGFDGLEVRDARAERASELREAVAAGGVIPTCCPPADGFLADFDPLAGARARERLSAELDGIAALGGHGVISPAAWGMWTERLPPFDPPPRTSAEDRSVLVEQLSRLGAHAAAAGVVLLFEPLNRYEDHMVNTLATAADLIEEAGSPGVRVLADTYHMNIEEDDICEALRATAPLLGAVHLSDSGRGQPGTGHVPFAAVIDTLAGVGFEGTLSVECRLRGEPARAVADCGAYLRHLLAGWS